MGQLGAWQDRVPEELIEALVDADEYVQFTDAWRELSAEEQLGFARDWLRKTLGLEASREEIDARAAVEAEKRGCGCGGARNCGCWNLAMRLLLEERG